MGQLPSKTAGAVTICLTRSADRPTRLLCGEIMTEDNSKFLFFFFNLKIFYFWLLWVFIAVHGLSLVAAMGAAL